MNHDHPNFSSKYMEVQTDSSKKTGSKTNIFMHLISHIQYAAKIFVMLFSPYFDTFLCFLLCISVSVGQYHSEIGLNVS